MLSTQQGKNEQVESSITQLSNFTENYLTHWESDLKDSYLLALFIANNSPEDFCQAYGQIYCLNFLTLEYYIAQANQLVLSDELDSFDLSADIDTFVENAQYMLNICADMAERMQSTYFSDRDFVSFVKDSICDLTEGRISYFDSAAA